MTNEFMTFHVWVVPLFYVEAVWKEIWNNYFSIGSDIPLYQHGEGGLKQATNPLRVHFYMLMISCR